MMITTNGLGKRFGQVEVLKSIDFQVAAREIVVLLGPSGSGKSTLLRCLNGLEELSSGKFEVNGIEVDATAHVRVRQAAIRDIRKQTGMVFQQFNLYPHKTAIGNVIEGLLTVKKCRATRLCPSDNGCWSGWGYRISRMYILHVCPVDSSSG